jgi:hypothetical protein
LTDQTPTFFVPLVDEAEQEDAYVGMAKVVGAQVPHVGDRIYSITYKHNGEVWTATVGKKLSGTVWRTHKSRGQKIEREHTLSNGATVLAIFAGYPFHVWHDNASRIWSNPFLAGEPTSVVRFATKASN